MAPRAFLHLLVLGIDDRLHPAARIQHTYVRDYAVLLCMLREPFKQVGGSVLHLGDKRIASPRLRENLTGEPSCQASNESLKQKVHVQSECRKRFTACSEMCNLAVNEKPRHVESGRISVIQPGKGHLP